uniref:Vacuole membrane protein n=1 Tax=Solanum tuberosum TaxID=4113 RepID=M1CAZ0_SOLTU
MGSLEQEQLLDSPLHVDNSASAGLLDKHNRELEHLSLTNQPLKTVKFFCLAVLKCLHQFSVNTMKCNCLVVILLASAGGSLLFTRGRAYEEVCHVFLCYNAFRHSGGYYVTCRALLTHFNIPLVCHVYY